MSLMVDKRWCAVISSSVKAMKKLPLAVNPSRGSKNKEMLKFSRRYQVIELKEVVKKLPKYIETALMKLGSDVKTMNIIECNFDRNFLEVLRSFPKVEIIDIKALNFNAILRFLGMLDELELQADPSMFCSLKKLKISGDSSVSQTIRVNMERT